MLAASLVAVAARLGFALLSFAVNHISLIPDESQYLGLSSAVASGRGSDSWQPGYGSALFRSTWPYSALLSVLMRLFGSSRLVGQLYSAVFGVATVAITVWVAMRVLSCAGALAAGLVVALLPSQVLWSSVVLRESIIWACLAGIGACLIAAGRSPRMARAVWATAALVALVFALNFVRSQTAITAGWAAAVAALALPRGRRVLAVVVLGAALVAPSTYGIGPGGVDLINDAAGSLDTTRTVLGLDATTGLSNRMPYTGADSSVVCSGRGSSTTALPGASAISTATTIAVQLDDGTKANVVCIRGAPYIVHDGGAGSLSSISDGIAVTFIRPYPWEPSESTVARLAALESIAWYVLYVLGVLGLIRLRRSYDALLYPFLVGAGLSGLSVLTQGNLGTAFRHRGQSLWVLAIFAAAGAEWVVAWRRDRRAPAAV